MNQVDSSVAKGAVVLLSGGLDSTTCLAWALAEGYQVTALSLDYGQRHQTELERARQIAAKLGVPHRVLRCDLAGLGGSALTEDGIDVPKGRDEQAMGTDIPVTYVPARNTVLLALALACAEASGARALVIGANAVDYSGYPDCRPAFLEAFETLANLATKAGVEGDGFQVLAPLLELSKKEIVELGTRLNAPLELTLTCYDPHDGLSCGACDACQLRLKGFAEAGQTDPIPYRSAP